MEEKKKQNPNEPQEEAILVRILGQDIPGNKNLYSGLTRIKGVSWGVANAICLQLGLEKRDKISSLDKPSIAKIEKAVHALGTSLPNFLKNRRADPDSGENKHIFTSDLDIHTEFDIKRMKKMRSYRGVRHSLGQPVRGQSTRSHFRKRGSSVGVRKNEKKA